MTSMKWALPAALIAMTGFTTTQASAADADHFKGKTMTIAIGYGFGGTYGKYARVFSKHLGKHIPGNPTIVVKSMPGAGGMKMVNYAYAVMPKAGHNLLVPPDTIVINQLMRPKKMRFDAREFRWLGSSNQTNSIMVVRLDTGVSNVKDMKKIKILGGTSGKASNGYISPKLTMGLLGLKGDVIAGYKGSSRSILAIEQGEVQMASFNWLTWKSKVPHWFKGKKPYAKAILQVGSAKDPELPDVPMLTDMVSGENKAIVNFIATSGALGRGMAVPPGVPKDILATLRKAYDGMNADPAFKAELEKGSLRLMATKGVALQKIVNDAVKNANPTIVKRATALIYGGKSG
jgi:tripartite-type tricarboxylate transporter receptor subunit TctC